MTDRCRNLASDVAAGRLTRDELDEIMADLEAAKAAAGLDAVEARVLEQGRVIAEESKLAAMIEKRNRLQNIVVEDKLWQVVLEADEKVANPALGLESSIVGVNTRIFGGQRSVDSLAQGLSDHYRGGIVADLRKADLLTQFNTMKGDFSRQVARALHDLNRKTPAGVDVPPDAMSIARIMQKYQSAARERQNRAGAYIRRREDGYIVRQTHKPERMAGKRAEWIAELRGRLDFDAMDVPAGKIDEFLDSAYSAIVSGVRLTQPLSDISRAFTGPGNLAKKASAERTLIFKSADDWFDYDQKFGDASLRESFFNDLDSASRNTALMRKFSTNPQAMLERIVKRAERKWRDDPKKLKGFRGGVVNLQSAMDEVTGDINIGSSDGVARYLSGFRALQTMAKLGGAWVSALSDIAFIAANRKFQGRTMMQAWGDALSAFTTGMSRKDMRVFADLYGTGLEGMMGDFMSRFNAADQIDGKTSKMMATFFKLNLLGPWTDANKRGVTMMIARDLAMSADRAYDALPPDLARLLGIYGIDGPKWDVARRAVRRGPDGRDYLFPGDVVTENLRLQDDVRESLFALITSEADFAVPSPGARERAIMRRGYRPGTTAGEAIRFVGQFKSFSVVSLTKVMGRQIYGSGSKTLREQLARGVGENLGLINVIAGSTVLGYFVLQAKELIKGRNPRPNDKATLIAAMLQGGGAGIYGDFLFAEYNRFGGGALATLAGPGLGTVADAVNLFNKAKWGEDPVGGDLVRLAKSNLPFANLFYVKGAMDYLIWYQLQEMINPGYLKRMERRVKRENNQTFWAPPSAIVATGGGFRR